MNWRRISIWSLVLLFSIAGIWVVLRTIFPPREVNYLNFLLLRHGSSIEEIEQVIGPHEDLDESDPEISAIINPPNRDGTVERVWFDKELPFGRHKIYITFVNGRATTFSYYSPSF